MNNNVSKIKRLFFDYTIEQQNIEKTFEHLNYIKKNLDISPIIAFQKLIDLIIINPYITNELNHKSDIKEIITNLFEEIQFNLIKIDFYNENNKNIKDTLKSLNLFCNRYQIEIPNESEIREKIKKDDEDTKLKIANLLSCLRKNGITK